MYHIIVATNSYYNIDIARCQIHCKLWVDSTRSKKLFIFSFIFTSSSSFVYFTTYIIIIIFVAECHILFYYKILIVSRLKVRRVKKCSSTMIKWSNHNIWNYYLCKWKTMTENIHIYQTIDISISRKLNCDKVPWKHNGFVFVLFEIFLIKYYLLFIRSFFHTSFLFHFNASNVISDQCNCFISKSFKIQFICWSFIHSFIQHDTCQLQFDLLSTKNANSLDITVN